MVIWTLASTGCNQPDSSSTTGNISAIPNPSQSTDSSSPTTTTSSNINAIQIIPKADSTGSFDATAVPLTGGISVKAQRLFGLDGSVISNGNIPTWFKEARAFLTSSRTSGPGIPSFVGSDTPCAYFDSSSTDINPDSSGFYTIDGYTPNANASDIDQCGGITPAEANQLGFYVTIDRRFMGANDKLQIIVKAKPLDAPNTSPTASSCVVGGFFDASACSNLVYTVTMRTAPGAAAKPFYLLFPSAKSLDLLSEAVLLPLKNDPGITTISIDRVKGGAIFYGLTVVRLQ